MNTRFNSLSLSLSLSLSYVADLLVRGTTAPQRVRSGTEPTKHLRIIKTEGPEPLVPVWEEDPVHCGASLWGLGTLE